MKLEKPLTEKTALITGASSGIGRETARILSRDGADVAIAARRIKELEKIANKIEERYDAEALAIQTDVREEKQVRSMIDKTIEQFGSLDIVVNNAGLSRGDGVENMTTEEYKTMMETNTHGMFYTTRESLPYLKKSEGNLIYIGSIAGQYPRPFNPVYAATKWWTRGFALSVESEVGDKNVAVTVINPSEVRTEFGDGEKAKEKYEKGEVIEPEEVAEAVSFASRQENSTISELDIYRRNKLSDVVR
ncbi:short-chain dehydrogenase [candidate division MSBL1 archaeon SCGC-AAA259E19]|uniref:Short-chain dehydrogenase n=2 Tax=candidate division MSBL1 TaxID=215777 RepID=A0A133UAA2_9EURY|nr:short-chain dehydrogenase [candidate division MSBL1 archaeon SCGC-AAA259A05]KXA93040.1 short-chain dehydrogenase [candidate division MSBL1 archaeon SCGC-AAA259E19]